MQSTESAPAPLQSKGHMLIAQSYGDTGTLLDQMKQSMDDCKSYEIHHVLIATRDVPSRLLKAAKTDIHDRASAIGSLYPRWSVGYIEYPASDKQLHYIGVAASPQWWPTDDQ
jgi:hypothetical protein